MRASRYSNNSMSALLSCKMPSTYYGICAEKILNNPTALAGWRAFHELKSYERCTSNAGMKYKRSSRWERTQLSQGDFRFMRGPTVNLVLTTQGRSGVAPTPATSCCLGSNICRRRTRSAAVRDGEHDATSGRPIVASTRRLKTTFPVEAPVLKTCTGTLLYLSYSCKHYAPLISLCLS